MFTLQSVSTSRTETGFNGRGGYLRVDSSVRANAFISYSINNSSNLADKQACSRRGTYGLGTHGSRASDIFVSLLPILSRIHPLKL